MVLARLIEPTSKAQVPRVLGDLGLEPVSTRTLFREATARACLGLCSSTSPPVGAWPCACMT